MHRRLAKGHFPVLHLLWFLLISKIHLLVSLKRASLKSIRTVVPHIVLVGLHKIDVITPLPNPVDCLHHVKNHKWANYFILQGFFNNVCYPIKFFDWRLVFKDSNINNRITEPLLENKFRCFWNLFL